MRKWIGILALLPSVASAGDVWGSLNLTSLHAKTEKRMNQRNLGVGLEYHHNEELVLMAGGFYNSHRRRSAYLLGGWTPLEWKGARFGLAGGLVNGYPKHNNGKLYPAAAGLIRLEGERVGANIFIIPPFVKDTPLTIGFQVKYRF
jgi:hypothetical protein